MPITKTLFNLFHKPKYNNICTQQKIKNSGAITISRKTTGTVKPKTISCIDPPQITLLHFINYIVLFTQFVAANLSYHRNNNHLIKSTL